MRVYGPAADVIAKSVKNIVKQTKNGKEVMAFGVYVFDGLAASVRAEKDNHSDVGDFFEDNILYQLQFI